MERKQAIRRRDPDMEAILFRLVAARDGRRCATPDSNCTPNLQLDHVKAKVLGGSDEVWNRQILCSYHNQSKGAKPIISRPWPVSPVAKETAPIKLIAKRRPPIQPPVRERSPVKLRARLLSPIDVLRHPAGRQGFRERLRELLSQPPHRPPQAS